MERAILPELAGLGFVSARAHAWCGRVGAITALHGTGAQRRPMRNYGLRRVVAMRV